MDLNAFMSDFEKIAKSVLFNSTEITPDALAEVKTQLENAMGAKNPPRWAVVDWAMIRLKLYLKIGLTEEDELLLKNADKAIANAIDEDSKSSGGYGNFWLASV